MSFKKNKYVVVKKVISKDIANLAFNYLLLKKEVFSTTKFNFLGTFEDPQAPNTYSTYGDILMDSLLKIVKPVMEKYTNLKLVETYSYSRLYKKGDILHKHKDRPSCEISSTMNLGGDLWPIYLENNKVIEVNLKPGDILIYRGCDLAHWRDKFKGKSCGQVFLHYNNLKSKEVIPNKYDGRFHLGLPHDYQISNKR